MRLVDTESNPRISAAMRTMDSLLQSADPRELMEELIGGIPGQSGRRAYAEVSAPQLPLGGYRLRKLRNDTGEDLLGETVGERPALRHGGLLEQITRTPVPKLLHQIDLSQDPVLPRQMQAYHSAIAIPLFNNQSAEDWIILFDRDPEGFGGRDLEEVLIRATLVTTAANNLAVTRQLLDANLKIQEEITAIAAIQRALLPEKLPAIPGLRLAASYETLGQAGGDVYDLLRLMQGTSGPSDQRWAILVGDVSGHGPAAAMVMAMIHSILHAYPRRPSGPGELLTHINRQLCDKQLSAVFATAFLAIYEPATRSLTYARAGHHPPLLLTPGDTPTCRYLDEVGSLPIGVYADTDYDQATVRLEPGHVLVLYTDGVTETKNPSGEMLEVRGLESAVLAGRPDAQGAVLAVHQAMLRHADGARPADDHTILAVEVLPGSPPDSPAPTAK